MTPQSNLRSLDSIQKQLQIVADVRPCHRVPFQALAVEAKLLDQTLTLKLASNLAAKVVGDHLQSGLGRGHDDRAAHPQQFAAALFHSRSERKKVAVSKESGSKHQSSN